MNQNLPTPPNDSPDPAPLFNAASLDIDNITDRAGNGYSVRVVNGELAFVPIRPTNPLDALHVIAEAVRTAEAGLADPLTNRTILLQHLITEVTAAIREVTR